MRPLFRRLFPGGRYNHQQFFRSNLFGIYNRLHSPVYRSASPPADRVTQRFGDAAGVAGLRGGNQRDVGTGGRGRGGYRRAGLLIQHAPEIARYPGEPSGREVAVAA